MGNAFITDRCSYNYACVENLPNSTAGMLSCVCVRERERECCEREREREREIG